MVEEAKNQNQSFNLQDGRFFANQFMNRTFETNVGRIYMSSFGDRRTELCVRHFDQFGQPKVACTYSQKNAQNDLCISDL